MGGEKKNHVFTLKQPSSDINLTPREVGPCSLMFQVTLSEILSHHTVQCVNKGQDTKIKAFPLKVEVTKRELVTHDSTV